MTKDLQAEVDALRVELMLRDGALYAIHKAFAAGDVELARQLSAAYERHITGGES